MLLSIAICSGRGWRAKVELSYHCCVYKQTMSVQKKVTRSNSKDESDNSLLCAITDKLDAMHREMCDFRQESKDMALSINSTHEKIDELSDLVRRHDSEIKECGKDIDILKSENAILKRQVEELKSEVAQSQQYSRANCVDFDGVPALKGENIMHVVQSVAKAVHFNLEPGMIDAVHRMRRGMAGSRPPRIIVKFVRRIDKDELIRCAKVKQGFAASDAGFVSENRIYIRQSMSPETRSLFSYAKSAAQSFDYKFVWFSDGKVLMRKKEGANVIHVSSRSQLSQLFTEGRRGRADQEVTPKDKDGNTHP